MKKVKDNLINVTMERYRDYLSFCFDINDGDKDVLINITKKKHKAFCHVCVKVKHDFHF